MALYLPAGIRQIAADEKHPYFVHGLDISSLAVFVNDEPVDLVTVADEINGYVKFVKLGPKREITFDKLHRVETIRRKGVVHIYIKKDAENVD